MTSRRNVYVNPLERGYVAIVHRRWLNDTYYMPSKGWEDTTKGEVS